MSSITEDDDFPSEPTVRLAELPTVARRGPRVWPWLLTLGLYGALNFTLSFLRPALDEPAALRWLRALNEHPLRAVLAIGLLIVGWIGLRPTGDQAAQSGLDEIAD